MPLGESRTTSCFENDIDQVNFKPALITNNLACSYFYAIDLLEEYASNNRVDTTKSNLKDVILNLTSEDNPVIQMAYLKD